MQHIKFYIQNEDIKRALGYPFDEIENLERAVRNLENTVNDLESEW